MATLRFNVYGISTITIIATLTLVNCTPLPVTNLSKISSNNKCSLHISTNDDAPLLLTPFVDHGCFEEARRLSCVRGVPGMTWDSFSGFLTVGQHKEANLFFWFFPSKKNPRTAPVLLWLNGGPGTSSLSGLFAENGPYYVTEEQALRYREYNWATEFNMIYLDNPVGAGFSFAQSKDDYRNSSSAIAQDIYEALVIFFKIFNQYAINQFYVVGQSYGGKFAVHLADLIDSKNSVVDSSERINLKGIICSAGFLNPPLQVKFADYWLQVGLLNPADYNEALSTEEKIQQNLSNGNVDDAITLLLWYLYGGNSSFMFKSAGFNDGENILQSVLPSVFQAYPTFISSANVRRSIHVANLTFVPVSSDVFSVLYTDFTNEVTSVLEQILNKGYKVLMMSGNLDIYVVPTVHRKLVWDLQWEHTKAFHQSQRTTWKVDVNDKDFAGYLNCAKNLCHSLVRNGGHRLSRDQTRSTADLIRRFIHGLLPVG